MPLTTKARVPTTTLDFMAEETAADPWPLLADLRALGPVVWHETYQRWVITHDREVRAVASDWRRFTVEGTTVEAVFGPDAFFSMDDRPRHDELRGVWADAFRKPGIERMRPAIRAIVERVMAPVAERLRAGESVDLADAVCRPVPTLVIALMMGVADAMLPQVVRWSDAMAAGSATYLSEEAARAAVSARERAKAEFADFLRDQLAWRRRRPGEDLISHLAQADVGRRLEDDRLTPNLRQLLFAGNETTAKWLAQIFLVMGQRPELQRELAADRGLIAAANDEVMRWQTIVGTIVRQVRGGPVALAGVELADGAPVTCLLGSANRDPARFEDPDRFDIHRRPEPNLGFGLGLHHCLGINLAKVEAELTVGALLDAAPRSRSPRHTASARSPCVARRR